MKHLKTYEGEKFMPQVGDYVVMYHEHKVCKILKLFLSDNDIDITVNVNIYGKSLNITIGYPNLKRYATEKEIEKFKLELDVNKYNL